jgi:hypothetical protein
VGGVITGSLQRERCWVNFRLRRAERNRLVVHARLRESAVALMSDRLRERGSLDKRLNKSPVNSLVREHGSVDERSLEREQGCLDKRLKSPRKSPVDSLVGSVFLSG